MKTTGILLILGALGVFIPYTVLTITFQYPDILRQPAGSILMAFHQGGGSLIFTWWAFAVLGLPLVAAYSRINKLIAPQHPGLSWAGTLGIVGLIAQMTGLLRWVFVVPVLAQDYVSGDAALQASSVTAFKLVHQFAGVLLGEYIGQLFTIIWTVVTSYALAKMRVIPKLLAQLGYLASFIYIFAETELINTVVPSLPVVEIAGFLGSTLWLVWLIATGVIFLQKSAKASPASAIPSVPM